MESLRAAPSALAKLCPLHALESLRVEVSARMEAIVGPVGRRPVRLRLSARTLTRAVASAEDVYLLSDVKGMQMQRETAAVLLMRVDAGYTCNGPCQAARTAALGAGPRSGTACGRCATAWWGSGGGFSDTFAIPAFQADAVAAYKQLAASSLPDASKWNQTGAGFPDVAALAGNKNQYCITLNGGETGAYGTSAATPVWGAVVALLNEQRLAAGKSPMGFLNPWLYSLAGTDAFTDITSGTNNFAGCLKTGYSATAGWDAVTGLGTPNFEALLEAALAV